MLHLSAALIAFALSNVALAAPNQITGVTVAASLATGSASPQAITVTQTMTIDCSTVTSGVSGAVTTELPPPATTFVSNGVTFFESFTASATTAILPPPTTIVSDGTTFIESLTISSLPPTGPVGSSLPPTAPASSLPPTAPASSLPPTAPASSLPPTAPASSFPPTAPASSLPPTSPASSLPPTAPASSLPPTAPANSAVTGISSTWFSGPLPSAPVSTNLISPASTFVSHGTTFVESFTASDLGATAAVQTVTHTLAVCAASSTATVAAVNALAENSKSAASAVMVGKGVGLTVLSGLAAVFML